MNNKLIQVSKSNLESLTKTLNSIMGANKSTNVKDNVAKLEVSSPTMATITAHAKSSFATIAQLSLPIIEGVTGQVAYINVYAINKVIKHLGGDVLVLDTKDGSIGDKFTTIPLIDLTSESEGYFEDIYRLPLVDSRISTELLALDSEKMLEVLGKFNILSANDELRPILNGVCFFNNNNAKELSVAASNGFYVGLEKLSLPKEDNNVEENIIIFNKDVDVLLKVFTAGQSLISITRINNAAMQVTDGINSVYFRPIEGRYPNVYSVIPSTPSYNISVATDILVKAIAIEKGMALDPKRASLIISTTDMCKVYAKSNLGYRLDESDTAEARTKLENATIDSNGMADFAFSAVLCETLLKAVNFGLKKKEISKSVLTLGVSGPDRIILFNNGSDVKYGLVPIQITD